MTYEELKIGDRIRLREKPDDEQKAYKMVTYTVAEKISGYVHG